MDTSTQPPSSPGISPVDCIEELLKFTLKSSIEAKLRTSLSTQYCAAFLRADDDHPSSDLPLPTINEVCKDVPSYPLYKRLASSIFQSISSGALCTASTELTPGLKHPSLEIKYNEWNKLIGEKGHSLLTMLKEVDFELHVQEPFFSQINDGLKTIEGRCAVGDYKRCEDL